MTTKTKTCPQCGESLGIEEFYKAASNADGLYTQCKTCVKRKHSEYRKHNRKVVNERERRRWQNKSEEEKQAANEKGRERRLQRVYGISTKQYSELLKKQNHRCAICEKHQDDEKQRFAVDHNHITGEIRGLLCYYCNHRVVGKHRDGVLLRKIADYVEQGTGWFVPKKKRTNKRKKGTKTSG